MRPQTLTWFRDPLRLTVLYSLSIVVLGQPVVWIFDPEGTGGAFAGLILAAFTLLVSTGFVLILPRRWGMSLFALEAILIWVANMLEFSASRVFSAFILWSILELPMYGFEILGFLEPPTAPAPPPRESSVPPLLWIWLLVLVGAFVVSYIHEHRGPAPRHSSALWALAIVYLPLPPLLAARGLVRRAFRPRAAPVRVSSG